MSMIWKCEECGRQASWSIPDEQPYCCDVSMSLGNDWDTMTDEERAEIVNDARVIPFG